jgi:ribosome-binding protein aMBF1 (putative translation factor)
MTKMARTKNSTANAVEILRKRYVRGDAERGLSVASEHLSAEIARTIYELRKEAGLSQKDLAELISTTQSVISRLEDSDYDGHSLSMLERIAKALNKRIIVSIGAPEVREDTVHYAFRRFVQNARRKSGLTVKEASKKLDIDSAELESMESDTTYCPSFVTLHKLSQFYGVNQARLAALAGALKKVPRELKHRASKFTEQSESLAKLSGQEKKALDEFMRFLKNA